MLKHKKFALLDKNNLAVLSNDVNKTYVLKYIISCAFAIFKGLDS